MSFTHRVRLHFRQLSPSTIPFLSLLRNAERVYAQYSIKIEYASGKCLALNSLQQRQFQSVGGTCKWIINSGEREKILRMGGFVPHNEITVYFINQFDGSQSLGCGGHLPKRPACMVVAKGSPWTMAHEVGHVLLGNSFKPVHVNDTTNLMYSSTPGITATLPGLNSIQVQQMKSSICAQVL